MYGTQDFHELHKTAYSHGLESIYSIENIDLRTVRRLQETSVAPAPTPKKKFKLLKSTDQYELDFGTGFREWIPPFFPQEPIRNLGLSKFAEKALIEQGKHKIGDLLDSKGLKGLGQGHLIEIEEKVAKFTQGRDPQRAETIDFAGWVRALFANLEPKKLYPLLEKYQLQDLIAITPAEKLEVKRMNAEQRDEACREAHLQVDRSLLEEGLKSISHAFLIPWIALREGIATQGEVEERLERMADDGDLALKALKLCDGCFAPFFFGKHLIPLTGSLFAMNSAYAAYGKIVLKLSATYFYAPHIHYPFQALTTLLKRELACYWVGLPDRFVEKILFTAPEFRLSKNLHGQLLIYPNATLRAWHARHA